jgi:branched-chain amino acid transport system substrate-binding protein
MVEDNVTMIFGCYTSSSRKATLPVVERLNGLLWYPTIYEGFEYSPNVIYTSASPNQNSVGLQHYLMNHYGKRFFFVGSDYVYPRKSNRIMGELVRQSGGEVVGERYLPLGAKRDAFLPVMRDIKNSSPDVIFSTVVGTSTIYLYQSYVEFGFDSKVVPIASLTTTEAEIRAMGYDVGEGHITSAPYFQGIKSEINASFIRRYKDRYGQDEDTNMCLEAAYYQIQIFGNALAQTNSMDTQLLRSMVLGSKIDAPQGKISVNPYWGHTNLWTRIGCANRGGQFDLVYESSAPISADPYLLNYGGSVSTLGEVAVYV